MKICIALALMATLVVSLAEALVDTKPLADPRFKAETSPTCFMECAEYKAMGACEASWESCNSAFLGWKVKDFCQATCEPEPDPCSPNPCKNGGVCVSGVCYCKSGCSGTYCESCNVNTSCWVEAWGGPLDDSTWQASINTKAVPNILYQVDKFYNGIGTINGVSTARVVGTGCAVSFKNNAGTTMCILRSGDYPFDSFVYDNGCGNDVVTQYTIEIGEDR